jgi:hypothetical protein
MYHRTTATTVWVSNLDFGKTLVFYLTPSRTTLRSPWPLFDPTLST